MNLYRGFGLTLALSSLVLAIVTYMILGLHPLIALWLGLAIVGFSMFLTPEEPREELRVLARLAQAQVENIARVAELLNLRGPPVFKTVEGRTYIILSRDPPDPKMLGDLDVSKGVLETPWGLAMVLRSPGEVSVESSEPCSSIEEALVHVLGIADWVTCSRETGRIVAEVVRAKVIGGFSLTVPGVFAASIASRVLGRPVILKGESVRGDRIVIEVDVVE
ncbi:MAG: hypothetical protein QXX84_02260 [Sulfolobales archaeon]